MKKLTTVLSMAAIIGLSSLSFGATGSSANPAPEAEEFRCRLVYKDPNTGVKLKVVEDDCDKAAEGMKKLKEIFL